MINATQLIDELTTTLSTYDVFGTKSEESFDPYNRNLHTEFCSRIKDSLCKLFPSCNNVIYTLNTDRPFFGVYVNPTITPKDVATILFTSEPYAIHFYTVELDSKLFTVGLDAREITSLILNEVSAIVNTELPIQNLREIIDLSMLDTAEDSISITKTIDYAQLMIFAIKDSLRKLTSCFYTDANSELGNKFISDNDLTVSLGNALLKVLNSTFGLNDTVRSPKLTILQWAFSIYQDLNKVQRMVIKDLTDAKDMTGSQLVQGEIDKVIRSLYRIPATIQTESTNILMEARSGLFNALKQNGLRTIEDDLYEFRVRSKNAETEDDAMYTLRQINTRINIIDEYLYRNEGTLSIGEKERWLDVASRYRDLREEISRKTISHKKQYGLFYDYDKI